MFLRVKICFDIAAEELRSHFKRHAALYSKRRRGADRFNVDIIGGQHCSAIWIPTSLHPKMFLDPVGHQLASNWMVVRFQDKVSWDLSFYNSFDCNLTHSVDPWAWDPEFEYNVKTAKEANKRIDKLCELLPQFADEMRPYLLLWRYAEDPSNPGRP